MDVKDEQFEIKPEPLEQDVEEQVSRIVIFSQILGENRTKLFNSVVQITIVFGRYIFSDNSWRAIIAKNLTVSSPAKADKYDKATNLQSKVLFRLKS